VRQNPKTILRRFFFSWKEKIKSIPWFAVMKKGEREEIVGVGRYGLNKDTHTADVAFAVMDNYHNKGIGTELFSYLTFLAKKQGLLGFTAEVLMDNRPMLHLCQKMGFDMEKTGDHGVYELKMMFRKK
jgi:RimJ/RimL family protein N-acetyltransferase